MLWDVDHTLIENGGMSKATYAKAFTSIAGREPEFPAETDGRTDPQIMSDMLERNGFPVTPDVRDRIPAELEAALESNIPKMRERGCALPGSHEVLELASKVDGLVQSALTGNIIANAKLKLAAFSLDGPIDWEIGGFGSDSAVRSELVGVARSRVEEKFGTLLPLSSIVLVGDTLRDIEAGVDSGARVIGVATGKVSADDLLKAGADRVFESMEDAASVIAAVRDLVGLG